MSSRVRIIHNIPKAPKVNIFLGEFEVASNLAYTKSTPYLELTAGDYVLDIKAGDKIIYTDDNLILKPNQIYTAIIHGPATSPELLILMDDQGCLDESRASVRVIHAAYDLDPVNIYVDDKLVYELLVYTEKGDPIYNFPAKKTDFSIVKPNTIRPLAGPYEVDLQAGGFYTFIIGGTPGKEYIKITEDTQKVCIQTGI